MHFFARKAMLLLNSAIASVTSSAIPSIPAAMSSLVLSTATSVTPVVPIVTYVPSTASPEASVTRIASYNNAGFENLALRSNGQILATIAFPSGLLFYIDPLSIRPAIVLHNFTSLTSTLGITEKGHDIFYVVGAGANGGPFAVYSVDMQPFVVLPNGTIFTPPVVIEIGSVPSALALNGMTSLSRRDDFFLISDSLLGGVWKFDIETGASKVIIKDQSMAGPPNKTEFAALGINGLRIQNDTLFYCNSGAQSFYKMPLHLDGSCAGNATLITSGIACDDFALGPWGFAYVASPRNALIKLDTRTGAQLVVAGTFNESSSDIISASSVRFGVGDSDRSSVYVTTNGGAFVGAPPGSQGISRVDVGDLGEVFRDTERMSR